MTARIQRIGSVGFVWATKYSDGWTVYTTSDGIVARGVSKSHAYALMREIRKAKEKAEEVS